MAETTTNPSANKESVPASRPGNLTAGTGWAPFDNLRREIDRVFQNMGVGSLALDMPRSPFDLSWSRDISSEMMPAVDVAESADAYEITAELPGMDQKDVDVKLANGTLTIRGEKRMAQESDEQGHYLCERRYGAFSRTFRIPEGIDTDGIDAQFTQGVLKIRLPKTTQAQQNEKTIEVKSA